MGREIVDEVREEFVETGSRLLGHHRHGGDLRPPVERPCAALPESPGDARTCPACRRRRGGRGPQVVRHRARRALHGRGRARIGGGRDGRRLLHAGSARRLTQGDLLPQHVRTRGAPPLRRRGHRVPRGRAGTPLPAHHRHGVPRPARGPTLLHDTACAEGWGLYSERLADEMGLYSDDLARMGLFAADSWRASRLVVDTGLHAMGWSRQQAVDWMAEHTPLPRIEVESEVDRYISYPGQALAYMVGRREIVRLRSTAADDARCPIRPQGVPRSRAPSRNPSPPRAGAGGTSAGWTARVIGRRRSCPASDETSGGPPAATAPGRNAGCESPCSPSPPTVPDPSG